MVKEVKSEDIDAMADRLFELGIEFRRSGQMALAADMLRTGMRMVRSDMVLRNDRRDLKRANEQLTEKSETDVLTGAPNRAGFERVAIHEISEMRRFNNMEVAFAYVDLDGFKAVNDTFGHEMGDNVLKEVVKRLQESFRTTDIVCRIGGDEIVIIMPFEDNNQFHEDRATEWIRDALAGLYVWDQEGNQPYPIGASIGLVSSNDPTLEGWSEPHDIMSEMKKLADKRMYEDKWFNGQYTEENKHELFHPKNTRLELLRVKARADHQARQMLEGHLTSSDPSLN
ncbi:MAG: GGDEF domain-containing protein [Alphaproteobacteria bacterium]|nr:GGDEF domain-containing protein [Alphaproteobacteria bacterium]